MMAKKLGASKQTLFPALAKEEIKIKIKSVCNNSGLTVKPASDNLRHVQKDVPLCLQLKHISLQSKTERN